MSKLFAVADLHLSGSGAKPMDVFGSLWQDHAARMAAAWDARVSPEDCVLLAGDLSWARTVEEVRIDLEWIEARPGSKLLLRGNHDSWWSSPSKVRALLPPSCRPLHHDSHEVGDWIVVGARGWTSPDDPGAEPGDARVFRRELERLEASLAHAAQHHDPGRPRLAMLHYPPWLAGRAPTAVVGVLERGRVKVCVYGHLHGDDHRFALQGEHRGIHFVFVAADAVGFAPVDLTAVLSARSGS